MGLKNVGLSQNELKAHVEACNRVHFIYELKNALNEQWCWHRWFSSNMYYTITF